MGASEPRTKERGKDAVTELRVWIEDVEGGETCAVPTVVLASALAELESLREAKVRWGALLAERDELREAAQEVIRIELGGPLLFDTDEHEAAINDLHAALEHHK